MAERVRAMDRVVEVVERQPEVKYELRLEEVLPSCVFRSPPQHPRKLTLHCHRITACLSESAGKDVRASVYRVLRHLVVDLADVEHLSQAHLPLFLIRCVLFPHLHAPPRPSSFHPLTLLYLNRTAPWPATPPSTSKKSTLSVSSASFYLSRPRRPSCRIQVGRSCR